MKIKFLTKHIKIFRTLGVDVVYLFGSYAEGNAHAMSDIDIGIVFRDPKKYESSSMGVYSDLYDVFIDVLPKKYLKKRMKTRAHEFDLVFLQYAPLDILHSALSAHRVLYQADAEREAEFRNAALKRYIDMSYLLKIKKQAILDRI